MKQKAAGLICVNITVNAEGFTRLLPAPHISLFPYLATVSVLEGLSVSCCLTAQQAHYILNSLH